VRGVGCFGDKFRKDPRATRPFNVWGDPEKNPGPQQSKYAYGAIGYEDIANGANSLVCRGKCFKPEKAGASLTTSCECYDGEHVFAFYDRKVRFGTINVFLALMSAVMQLDGAFCGFVGKDTSHTPKWALVRHNKYLRHYLYPKQDEFKCCGDLNDEGEMRKERPKPNECRPCCGTVAGPCIGMDPDDYAHDECIRWLSSSPYQKRGGRWVYNGKNPCRTKQLGETWGRRRRRRRRRRKGGLFKTIGKMASGVKKKLGKVVGKRLGKMANGVKNAIVKRLLKRVDRLAKKFSAEKAWKMFRSVIKAVVMGDSKQKRAALAEFGDAVTSGKLLQTFGQEVGPLVFFNGLLYTHGSTKLVMRAIVRGHHPSTLDGYESKSRGPPIPVSRSALRLLLRRMMSRHMEILWNQIRSYCEAISGGIDINAPTFAVTTQIYDAWGPGNDYGGKDPSLRGFMEGTGKEMKAWSLFAIKAPTEWWVQAARMHSKVKNGGCDLNKPGRKGRCDKLVKSQATRDALRAPWICIDEMSNECPMVPAKSGDGYSYPTELGGSLSDLAERRSKSSESFLGPRCVAEMQLSMSACNTCCCRGGYLKAGVNSVLIADDAHSSCAAWMGTIDSFIRTFMTWWRNLAMSLRFKTPCYKPFENRGRKKMLGSGDAVEQGRRGGRGGFGTTGTFSFVSGNRAGNSERSL